MGLDTHIRFKIARSSAIQAKERFVGVLGSLRLRPSILPTYVAGPRLELGSLGYEPNKVTNSSNLQYC